MPKPKRRTRAEQADRNIHLLLVAFRQHLKHGDAADKQLTVVLRDEREVEQFKGAVGEASGLIRATDTPTVNAEVLIIAPDSDFWAEGYLVEHGPQGGDQDGRATAVRVAKKPRTRFR